MFVPLFEFSSWSPATKGQDIHQKHVTPVCQPWEYDDRSCIGILSDVSVFYRFCAQDVPNPPPPFAFTSTITSADPQRIWRVRSSMTLTCTGKPTTRAYQQHHRFSHIIIYYHILSYIFVYYLYYYILAYINIYYPILSYIIPHYPILSYIIPYCHILSYTILYSPILSYIIVYYLILSYIISDYRKLSNIIL